VLALEAFGADFLTAGFAFAFGFLDLDFLDFFFGFAITFPREAAADEPASRRLNWGLFSGLFGAMRGFPACG
jgi:hypothetical protein